MGMLFAKPRNIHISSSESKYLKDQTNTEEDLCDTKTFS